jgi:hypothetical protein
MVVGRGRPVALKHPLSETNCNDRPAHARDWGGGADYATVLHTDTDQSRDLEHRVRVSWRIMNRLLTFLMAGGSFSVYRGPHPMFRLRYYS